MVNQWSQDYSWIIRSNELLMMPREYPGYSSECTYNASNEARGLQRTILILVQVQWASPLSVAELLSFLASPPEPGGCVGSDRLARKEDCILWERCHNAAIPFRNVTVGRGRQTGRAGLVKEHIRYRIISAEIPRGSFPPQPLFGGRREKCCVDIKDHYD